MTLRAGAAIKLRNSNDPLSLYTVYLAIQWPIGNFKHECILHLLKMYVKYIY